MKRQLSQKDRKLMARSESAQPVPPADAATTEGADPGSTATTPAPTQEDSSSPVTQQQAEQIIAELKSIKQNIFWLLLVAGFFAARSFFFHY
jgi:hypothetical protein